VAEEHVHAAAAQLPVPAVMKMSIWKLVLQSPANSRESGT
jgi:hypothetical protein